MKAFATSANLLLFFFSCVSSFAVPGCHQRFGVVSKNIGQQQLSFQRTALFSSPPGDEDKVDVVAPKATTTSAPPTPSEPEGTEYPIDLPSPLLLSTSMILAIIGIGSVFDLVGGSPSLGLNPTMALSSVTIPVCCYLFYASILKATAETEADDKEFMKGKY